MLRAMIGAVGDPARTPRSLTLHYAARPEIGPCEVAVTLERVGRSLATVSARLEQEGSVRTLAIAAFSPAWTGPELDEADAPASPRWEGLEALDLSRAGAPEFFSHVEVRPTLGGLIASHESMRTGGWARTRPVEPIDAPTAAFLLDAWWPSPYAALDRPVPAPTIDLTIHFRRPLPATPTDEPVLAAFRTRLIHEGFFEEDGELWSAEGVLLAQSRQLALLRSP